MNSNQNAQVKGPAQIHLTGQAGVYAVASELAIRGLHVHFPSVDYGYDLMIDHGIRIQVKAVRKRTIDPKYGPDAYLFKFWTPGTVYKKGRQRDYSSVCDFIVLWGVDERRFWIVPSALVANTTSVYLGPTGFYARRDFPDTRALAQTGLSKNEIAERLGITVQAVSYQLNGGRKRKPVQTATAQVRELEGRWDLITGALATLRDANDLVTDSQPVTRQAEPIPAGD